MKRSDISDGVNTPDVRDGRVMNTCGRTVVEPGNVNSILADKDGQGDRSARFDRNIFDALMMERISGDAAPVVWEIDIRLAGAKGRAVPFVVELKGPVYAGFDARLNGRNDC